MSESKRPYLALTATGWNRPVEDTQQCLQIQGDSNSRAITASVRFMVAILAKETSMRIAETSSAVTMINCSV